MAGGWLPLERSEDVAAQQRRLSERLLRILDKDPQRLTPILVAEPPAPPASEPVAEAAAAAPRA
jgi:hypothetical protein